MSETKLAAQLRTEFGKGAAHDELAHSQLLRQGAARRQSVARTQDAVGDPPMQLAHNLPGQSAGF